MEQTKPGVVVSVANKMASIKSSKKTVNVLYVILFLLCTAQQNAFSQERWNLQRCIDSALLRNLDLAKQEREIELKKYELQIAKRERLPMVQGYGNLYANFGRAQDVFGNIQRNDNLNSNMGITAEIMLYNFDRLRNQARQAAVGVDREVLEKEILDRELTMRVVEAYFYLLMQIALVDSRDSAVMFSQHLYERAEKTTQIGTTSASELHEAKANLAREKQQLQRVIMDCELAQLQLIQLLQIEDHNHILFLPDELDFGVGWEISSLEDLVLQSYQKQPSARRYVIWQQDLKLQEQVIKAGLYPTVTGAATLGTLYFNAFRQLMTDPFFFQTRNNFAQQLVLNLSIPIFDRGRTRSQLRQLHVRESQLRIENDIERLLIRQQIEKIYLDYKTNYQNKTYAEEARNDTQKALEFARTSFTAGQISIYELNTSRQNFIEAESELLKARYSMLFSLKMLQYQVNDTYMPF
ncbi:TolC family protein [Sphingobacterium sp. lm-10]|uniref:TolC family protein n=1 Tax=Sphingobacterium sp. lm-10 TaxID=2944904 RepID=UPI0020209FE0|nr:TolC family protein [Sphingobacterium sp. lm-10]MCL7989225.1 TolC family protein [Sphingobacterium sp. lm-10]